MTADSCFSEQNLERMNKLMGLSDARLEELKAAAAIMRQNAALWEQCVLWRKQIFEAQYDDPETIGLQDREMPWEQMGDLGGYFGLLVLLTGFDALVEMYESRRIPLPIQLHTLANVEDSFGECKRVYGHYGVVGTGLWWLVHHFTGSLFRLGRLQFVHRYLTEDMVFDGELILPAGSGVLDTHVPGDDRLHHDACLASYTMARAFYSRYFPEKKVDAIICHSWLLSSFLQEELPPDSNIIQFQSDYRLGPLSDPEDNSNMLDNVFQVADTKDYTALPENTTLQKNLKKRLLAGGTIGAAPGVLKDFYKCACLQ